MSTTSKKFFEFIWDAFEELVSPSWLTRFCKRYDLSLKICSNVSSRELTNNVFSESVEFLNYVKFLNFPPHKIIVIDKTSLRANPRKVFHLAPTGKNKLRHIVPKPGTVDIIYIYLKGDGYHS